MGVALPAALFGSEVQVERYAGDSAYGPLHDAATTVDCFIEEGRKLVRTAGGDEVVSETRLFCPIDTPDIPAESQVTVRGRATKVLASKRHDGGGLPTPDHLEVVLA